MTPERKSAGTSLFILVYLCTHAAFVGLILWVAEGPGIWPVGLFALGLMVGGWVVYRLGQYAEKYGSPPGFGWPLDPESIPIRVSSDEVGRQQ